MDEHGTDVKAEGIGWRAQCVCGWLGINWRSRVDALVDRDLHLVAARLSGVRAGFRPETEETAS